MKNNIPKVGQSELDVLLYVARIGPVSLRTAADHFGELRGWTRTTIQKTLERLVEKGLLMRNDDQTPLKYSALSSESELRSKLVGQFVEQSLGGSLTPFVAYLQGGASLTPEDIKELRKLVDELDRRENSK